MTDRFSRDLDEALSLYLDGRLEGPAREEFERQMEADPSLRQAVEFHRGLSLEFHEEAPPLPRGYDARARERLRQARLEPSRTDPAGPARGRAGATDRIAPAAWRRLLALETLAVAAALALVVTILYPRLSG